MTKAKARERAKKRAAQKGKKRHAATDDSKPKFGPGHFNPGSGSIKSPRGNANVKNFGGARRGASRSN